MLLVASGAHIILVYMADENALVIILITLLGEFPGGPLALTHNA